MRRVSPVSEKICRNLLMAAASAGAMTAFSIGTAWASCTVAGTQVTWNHGSSGNWNTGADWSGGVAPPAGDSVCVVDGKSTVTFNSAPAATIENLQLNSGNALDITGQSVTMTGTELDNAGTIAISGSGARIYVEGNVVLSGGGNVTLSNSALLQGAGPTYSLTNVDNTISGAGTIGGMMFDFTNEKTVNANVNGGTLSLGDISIVANSGLMEASNGGTLTISLGPTFKVNNTGGTIEADGTTHGATVNIASEIDGGTLETVNGGTMQTVAGSSSTLLNGVTLAAGSTYLTTATSSATTTELEGTIVNNGTFSLTAGASNALFTLDGNVTLGGSGTVQLGTTGAGTALIEELAGSGTLTNYNDIKGAGFIDSSSALSVLNYGTIDADVSGQTIFISSKNNLVNESTGIFQADSGGTLNLQYTLNNYSNHVLTGGSYNAESGTLQFGALGSNGAEITTNNANILLSGTGTIVDSAGKNALSALATNDAGANFTTANGQAFTTSANFTNSGTVTVASEGSASSFTVSHANSTFTNQGELQGTGTVVVNTLFNYGTVKPGDIAGTPGTLSITGNYTQGSNGTLDIEIGGTGSGKYGQLDISGAATLAGTLAVNLVNGFSLAMGDKFDILNAGTDPGDFNSFTFDGLSCSSGAGDTWHCGGLGSLYFQEDFLPGGQQLDLDVVPEPGSLMLIGSGLVAAGWLGRRRKRRA